MDPINGHRSWPGGFFKLIMDEEKKRQLRITRHSLWLFTISPPPTPTVMIMTIQKATLATDNGSPRYDNRKTSADYPAEKTYRHTIATLVCRKSPAKSPVYENRSKASEKESPKTRSTSKLKSEINTTD